MNLMNKTAIVTGAAGGIGAATARALAKQGTDVCLVDLATDIFHAESPARVP